MPRLEALEPRALLTTTALNPSALITIGGSIDQPRAMDVVPLLLSRDRLTPATVTQRTIVDLTVTSAEGSSFAPGSYRLVDAAGRTVHATLSRSRNALVGVADLLPGNYALQVRGQGTSTGRFVVQVALAGDADGSGTVNQSDVNAIRAALGTPTAGRINLDANRNGRIDPNDLALARENLGAASQTVTLQIANLTGTGPSNANPQFANSQIYVSIYGEVPSNVSPTNPSGWSYFDATGTPRSLFGPNGPLTTVPYFTLDQAPNGIAIPNTSVVNSAEIYVGLGSPVVLPVNSGVSGFTLTSGGSGYTSAPSVSLSGGTTATATLAQGMVTAAQIVYPGAGYSNAPRVILSGGGGSGATAVATVSHGQVTAIRITNPGSGYTSAPKVLFLGGRPHRTASAVARVGTGVAAVTLNSGGSGYTTAPSVTLAGGGGFGATATAVLTKGIVSAVNVTNPGTGYNSAPTVYFSGGSNATATATIASGAVTGLTVTNTGTGYTTVPTVFISGGGGKGATATAQIQITGVSAPSPSNPADPNQSAYWDFAEFTMNFPVAPTGPYINADLSQVDVVGLPMTLQLLAPNPSNNSPIVGVYPGRISLFQGYQAFVQAQNQPLFSSLATNTGSGGDGPFRILAPSDYVLLNPTDPLATYYNSYIGQMFHLGNTVNIQVADPGKPTAAQGTATVSAGGVSAVNVSNAGAGYTFPPVVSLQGGGGTGATATATINLQGKVTGVTITNAGTGYTSAPNVAFSPGTGAFDGIVVGRNGATGTATLASGSVSGVRVTDAGSGYTSPPAITITGGGGTGATATATINSAGEVNAVTITSAGTGYTSPPTVTFSPVDVTATGSATLSGNGVGSIQVANAGSGYTSPPIVTLSGGGGTGATASATINGAGNVVGVAITNPGTGYTTPPTVTFSPANANAAGTAALSGGGVGSVQVTDAGGGYTSPPTITFAGGGGTGATATATINTAGQVTGVTITSPGTGYTAPPTVVFSPATLIYQFTGQNGTQQGMQYNVYSPMTRPTWIPPSVMPTWMVFGNAGVFADNLDQFRNAGSAASKILGNIENQLVSAMSRGVALKPYSSWSDATQFYPSGGTANWYAAFLHQSTVTVGGLAYGFAFDDQGGNSTDISVSSPTKMIVNVGWKQALPTS